MPEDLQLLADLRALGREGDAPAPASLVDAVTGRVAALPRPPATTPAAAPGLFASRRRRVALVIGAVVLALLATPPVRAVVLEWFGFGGVRVEQGPGPDDAPPPPEVSGGAAVSDAADAVSFQLWLPAALGRPRGVEVSDDRRLVSMTWTVDGRTVRLDQFDGRLDFLMAKQSPGVRFTVVSGGDALWFAEPHEVVLLDPDGSRRTESARLAGHTLIWPAGRTTVRLEGDLSLTEAVAVAESAEPVG